MEQEKSEYSIKCEALETQTNDLKAKLQSSELEVNKLLHKCENLETQLQLLRKRYRTKIQASSTKGTTHLKVSV